MYKELTLESVVSIEYAIKMYRAITGACANGTKYFVERQKALKEEYSIGELIELTDGQYGSDNFRSFFIK